MLFALILTPKATQDIQLFPSLSPSLAVTDRSAIALLIALHAVRTETLFT
jgi:hypothetical protein